MNEVFFFKPNSLYLHWKHPRPKWFFLNLISIFGQTSASSGLWWNSCMCLQREAQKKKMGIKQKMNCFIPNSHWNQCRRLKTLFLFHIYHSGNMMTQDSGALIQQNHASGHISLHIFWCQITNSQSVAKFCRLGNINQQLWIFDVIHIYTKFIDLKQIWFFIFYAFHGFLCVDINSKSTREL